MALFTGVASVTIYIVVLVFLVYGQMEIINLKAKLFDLLQLVKSTIRSFDAYTSTAFPYADALRNQGKANSEGLAQALLRVETLEGTIASLSDTQTKQGDRMDTIEQEDIRIKADAAATDAAITAITTEQAANKAALTDSEAIVADQKATLATDANTLAADQTTLAADQTTITADQSALTADQSAIAADKVQADADAAKIASQAAEAVTLQGQIDTLKAQLASSTSTDTTALSADIALLEDRLAALKALAPGSAPAPVVTPPAVDPAPVVTPPVVDPTPVVTPVVADPAPVVM